MIKKYETENLFDFKLQDQYQVRKRIREAAGNKQKFARTVRKFCSA